MIAVELRFPAGRFHATPWGRHVNEGAVEWPVEPWRLLRALVATWFHKAHADVEKDTLVRLVTTLADTLPVYQLPAASLGHTRHYMPFNEGQNEKTTKIFDAFVHVADGEPVRVAWDVELPGPERAALALLLDRLGYLGRAESLVEAVLLETAAGGDYETRPLPSGGIATADQELVQVLAPLTGAAYETWRQEYLRAAAAGQPTGKSEGRSPKKPPGEPVPANLFDALLADTGALKAAGWNLPPGARRVSYVRRADAFRIVPSARPHRRDKKPPPTVARFALASNVLPPITAAVSVGDWIHSRLVGLSGSHPVFTGHEPDGTPRKGHGHAFVLPECRPGSDRICFLTIYAQDGFDDDRLQRALSDLTWMWGRDGHDIQLVLLGLGQPEDFAGNPDAGQSTILQESAEWVSLTPFVPTRHGKLGANRAPKLDADGLQIGGAEHDFRRLLRLQVPSAGIVSVEKQLTSPVRGLRWLQFQRSRRHGDGLRAGEFGYGFRVRFDSPVRGPLAVGYGAHFGLGLLGPAAAYPSR